MVWGIVTCGSSLQDSLWSLFMVFKLSVWHPLLKIDAVVKIECSTESKLRRLDLLGKFFGMQLLGFVGDFFCLNPFLEHFPFYGVQSLEFLC